MAQQFVKKSPVEQFESEQLPVGWPWRFFSISLVIFLAIIFVYLGLIFGYEPYLNSEIQKIDDQINKILEAVSKEEQEKFIRFYSRLTNLKNLLDNHAAASKIFPLLEKITNQKVSYNSFNLRVPERELELEGSADSYVVLGEQLESL